VEFSLHDFHQTKELKISLFVEEIQGRFDAKKKE
jgi:hypothetical protein